MRGNGDAGEAMQFFIKYTERCLAVQLGAGEGGDESEGDGAGDLINRRKSKSKSKSKSKAGSDSGNSSEVFFTHTKQRGPPKKKRSRIRALFVSVRSLAAAGYTQSKHLTQATMRRDDAHNTNKSDAFVVVLSVRDVNGREFVIGMAVVDRINHRAYNWVCWHFDMEHKRVYGEALEWGAVLNDGAAAIFKSGDEAYPHADKNSCKEHTLWIYFGAPPKNKSTAARKGKVHEDSGTCSDKSIIAQFKSDFISLGSVMQRDAA